MLFKVYSRAADHARNVAAETGRPVHLQRTPDGWQTIDEFLAVKSSEYWADSEERRYKYEEAELVSSQSQAREMRPSPSGMQPDDDIENWSAHDWARSDEDGWFYEE